MGGSIGLNVVHNNIQEIIIITVFASHCGSQPTTPPTDQPGAMELDSLSTRLKGGKLFHCGGEVMKFLSNSFPAVVFLGRASAGKRHSSC